MTTVEDFHTDHDGRPWNSPRPGRATFHYLTLVTEGELRHDVDRVTLTVAPGQWLWVRPGHVQCRHDPRAVRGPFTLFEPEVLRPAIARQLAPLTSHDADDASHRQGHGLTTELEVPAAKVLTCRRLRNRAFPIP